MSGSQENCPQIREYRRTSSAPQQVNSTVELSQVEGSTGELASKGDRLEEEAQPFVCLEIVWG